MKRIVFGESVQGASHKRVDKECQDSFKKIEFDDGTVCTYRPQGRSDYPNDNLFKQLAVGKTYNFRMGKFIDNHYGRKKSEKVENIISATIIS